MGCHILVSEDGIKRVIRQAEVFLVVVASRSRHVGPTLLLIAVTKFIVTVAVIINV
ncbi:hypothetical protein HJC99_05345 [Candidatus Saccharibacteria bacterium]|nr:hypothetical protein [Candidatus Saccharibacteria bacterium]